MTPTFQTPLPGPEGKGPSPVWLTSQHHPDTEPWRGHVSKGERKLHTSITHEHTCEFLGTLLANRQDRQTSMSCG